LEGETRPTSGGEGNGERGALEKIKVLPNPFFDSRAGGTVGKPIKVGFLLVVALEQTPGEGRQKSREGERRGKVANRAGKGNAGGRSPTEQGRGTPGEGRQQSREDERRRGKVAKRAGKGNAGGRSPTEQGRGTPGGRA